MGRGARHPRRWGRGAEEGGLDEQIGLCPEQHGGPRVLSEPAISPGSNAAPVSSAKAVTCHDPQAGRAGEPREGTRWDGLQRG